MNDAHEPRPEFVERLEWQIRSELRREERFTRKRPPWWRTRALRTAALVAISVLVGFAGATAAQESSERRALELLEQQSRLELQMAELQLSLAADRAVWVEGQVASGAAPDDELARAEWERTLHARAVELAGLDLQELRATGRPPRHDLVAPLVNDRDLVTERLRLHLEDRQEQLTYVAFQAELLAGQDEEGLDRALELDRLRAEVEQLVRQVTHLRQSLSLRRDFVEGKLEEAEVLGRQELMEARVSSERAQRHVDLARRQFERLTSATTTNEMDRMAAEYQLRMAEVQSQLAQLRLRALRRTDSENAR